MANTYTLGELKTLALDLSEQTLGFIGDNRLTDYANLVLGRLHDLIVRSNQDYLKLEQDYTLVSGQEEYDLPTNFYKVGAVFYMSGGDRFPVPSFNPRTAAAYQAPNTSGTIRLWYIPEFGKLTNDGQSVHPVIPKSWEYYVALGMAEMCLTRAKLDTGKISSLMAREEARIVEMLEPRNFSDAAQIEDVAERYFPSFPTNLRGLQYAVVGDKFHIMQEYPPAR